MFNIKTDSTRIKKDDTFVAIKGYKSDGHGYIDQAIKKGASVVVASYGEYPIKTIIVEDTKKYLEDYLFNTYQDIINKMFIIGITGTNGKTTTSYLIYQALNKMGIKCSYIGTIGYYLGERVCSLPNTSPDIALLYELIVDSYEKGYRYMVLEVSSQGLASNRFFGINFDVALFTNLTQEHLDYHINMKTYAYTKQCLFKKLKIDGIAIVNNDDEYKDLFMLDDNHNVTYGFGKSDIQVLSYKLFSNKTSFVYKDQGMIKVETKLLGKHNIYNVLATISVLNSMGIDSRLIKDVFKYLTSPPGRMDVIEIDRNKIIIDYAHTPDAIYNVLETVSSISRGNIYTVFGCTGNRDRSKRPIMTNMVLNGSKMAIITSDNLYSESFKDIVKDMLEQPMSNNYLIIQNRKEAIIKGITLLKNNDILLILGMGHEEYQIIGNNKIKSNDKDIVMHYIDSINIR